MSTPQRGRGRPVVFTPALRETYLLALRGGANLTEAAAVAGIAPRTARQTAQADVGFATAVGAARRAGRKARIERLPHGEYRYNHHKCRCDTCTHAASQARAARPDRARPSSRGVRVTPIPTPPPRPAEAPFPLLAAS